MRELIAFILFCALLVAIAAIIVSEHQAPLAMPLVKASEPASVVPWRLLTLCPVNSSNIPHYKDRTA